MKKVEGHRGEWYELQTSIKGKGDWRSYGPNFKDAQSLMREIEILRHDPDWSTKDIRGVKRVSTSETYEITPSREMEHSR